MLLAADVGNTNVVFALIDGRQNVQTSLRVPYQVYLFCLAVTKNVVDHPPHFTTQHARRSEIVGGIENEDFGLRVGLDRLFKSLVSTFLVNTAKLVVRIGGEPGDHLVPVVGVTSEAVDEDDGTMKGTRFVRERLGGAFDRVDGDGVFG